MSFPFLFLNSPNNCITSSYSFLIQFLFFKLWYIYHNHLHPGTSRVHWLRYDDNMVARDTWAKDLYKDFKSKVIKVKNAYTERFHWIFAIDYFCKFIFIMHCHFYNIVINNILLHNLKLYEKIIFITSSTFLQHIFNLLTTLQDDLIWPSGISCSSNGKLFHSVGRKF